jgi:ABC-type branched-subunit amino acid transport system substrate-binding protein
MTEAINSGDYKGYWDYGYGAAGGLPILASKKIVYVGTAPEEFTDPKKFPQLFGTLYSIGETTRVLGEKLAAKGYKNVALVRDSSAFGNGAESGFRAGLGDDNIATVQKVPSTLVDATPTASAILAADPDAIVVEEYGPALASVLTALDQAGRSVPLYGGAASAATDIASLAKPSAYEGMTVCTGSHNIAEAGNPNIADFQKNLRASLNGKPLKQGLNIWADVYSAARLWADAVNATKGYDSDKLTEWLESNGDDAHDYLVSTADGKSGYSPTRHIVNAEVDGNIACGEFGKLDDNGQYPSAADF